MVAAEGAAALLERAGEAVAAGAVDRAVADLSAAVRHATEAGEVRVAAVACARLGQVFQSLLGNKVAARPWFARAVRLVEGEPPCVEQAWVALAPMGCDVDDAAVLVERADRALELARRFGAVDLEIKALADGGLGRVQAGLVDDGMAMVDEAMALACGGGALDAELVAMSICSFYTACYHTADFGRVESWTPLLGRRGWLGTAPGTPAILTGHCGSVQASLLCHLGRFGEAEDVLARAHAVVEEAMPGAAWHTPIALAELRILQGRLAEAETLLLGLDDHLHALVPAARLHLARGDHDLALATARRGLRVLAGDRVRAAALLGVVVEAELARGDVVAAAAASAELDEAGGGLGLPALAAEAARVRARVRSADGDAAAAVAALQSGLAVLDGTGLQRQRMVLHLELARLLDGAGERSAAVVEARAASALLARLDVVLAPADAAVLEGLGLAAAPRPGTVGCRVATLVGDGGWWTVSCGETSARLRDAKGLRYLAELLSRPGAEHHVLDLVDRIEGVAPAGSSPDRHRLGDAGPLLDGAARDAYRRRVAELRDEVENALAVEDDDRAARAQGELDAVVAELARAFGLGGRDRRAASAAERARLNVTRALRAAIAHIAEALPEAGAALDRRVRTGLFCSYQPHPDDEAVWGVQRGVNGPGPG